MLWNAKCWQAKVCQCFSCPQVIYKEGSYDGEKVSVSELMTSPQYSIVSREAFEIYAANREIDALEFILQLDAYSFYMMNIFGLSGWKYRPPLGELGASGG